MCPSRGIVHFRPARVQPVKPANPPADPPYYYCVMMFRPVDLHCHSTASDGSLPPAEVVRLAADAGLDAVALTDHDTIDGLAEAAAAAADCGIDFLPGIEVSAAHPRPGTMHLLGYGFDPDHPAMRKLTGILSAARGERAERIVHRLRQLGINGPTGELSVADIAREGGTGRPHFAAWLVRHGHAVSTNDAFKKFLGGGGAAYVENNPLGPEQIIPLVRAAGGLVSLAHPFQLRRQTFGQLEAMVRELAEMGMEGLETLHGSHDTEKVHALTRLADRLELVPTGGSDFHGASKPWIKLGQTAGGRMVPRSFYDDLRARLDRRRTIAAA